MRARVWMEVVGFLSALVGFGLEGCGPLESTIRIHEAEVAVEAARLTEAATYAPFEYVCAEEYLHKAREERNYSDFEVAIEYAVKARGHAEEARKVAIENPRRGKGPLPPAAPSRGDRLE